MYLERFRHVLFLIVIEEENEENVAILWPDLQQAI